MQIRVDANFNNATQDLEYLRETNEKLRGTLRGETSTLKFMKASLWKIVDKQARSIDRDADKIHSVRVVFMCMHTCI